MAITQAQFAEMLAAITDTMRDGFRDLPAPVVNVPAPVVNMPAPVVNVAGAPAVAAANAGAMGRRLSPFTVNDPVEWRIWRKNFVTIALIAGWNDLQQRRQAASCMEGEAAKMVNSIDHEAVADIAALLDLYEARFTPAAAGECAKAEFRSARQMPGETLQVYHSRLRSLFERAFPNDDVEASITLRDQFVQRLLDPAVQLGTLDALPQNYQAALQAAQRKQAHIQLTAQFQMNLNGENAAQGGGAGAVQSLRPNSKEGEVQAIGAKDGDGRKKPTCWYCGKDGHVKQDCFKRKKAFQDKDGRRGDGKRDGKKDWNQGKKKDKAYYRKKLAALEAAEGSDEGSSEN